MNRTLYFTVIIPTFSRPALLAEAIDSVLQQTFADFEVLVVDDAGTPPADVPADPRIRLIRNEENLGKAASVNRALREARGRVIAFLDDDDAWSRTRLASAFAAHEAGADVVICGTGSLAAPDSTVKPPASVVVEVRPSSMGATSVVREKCPLFDESFAAVEDGEWAIRMLRPQPVVATIDKAEFLWRRHPGHRHGNGTRERIRGNLMLLEKHADHFRNNPREKAQRYHRIGLFHYLLGERGPALRYAGQSLRTRPNAEAIELALRVALPRNVSWARLGAVLRTARSALRPGTHGN